MRRLLFILLLLILSTTQDASAVAMTPAEAGKEANFLLEQLLAITVAADKLAQSSGSYSAANVSNVTLASVMPNGSQSLITQWGTAITVGTPTAKQYSVTIPQVPIYVCMLAEAKLKAYSQYTGLTPCNTDGPTDILYTYSATIAVTDPRTAFQYANSIYEQLLAITTAADKLAESSGSYLAANVSNATLASVLPSGSSALKTPWGTDITIGTPTQNQYSVTISQVPHNICSLALSRLRQNPHYVNLPKCNFNGSADIQYTYTASP